MIELRAPRLEELPRLREFMPLAFGFGASPICETAIIRETGALAGGWAFHLVDSQTKEACFFWRLNDEWLGSELPGTMMERLTAAARTAGATRLLRVRMVPEASPDARLLAANGFEIGHEVEWFEGDLAELWKRIERAWPEFERRGLPRMEARGIEERFLPEIRRLVLEQELVPEFELEHKLRGGAFGYARELSVVLLDEDKVRAVMLGTMFSPEVGEVDVEAVDRTAAQTTAALHALLLRTMIKGGLEAGVKMARFRAHPGRHRQTVNFARRSGARPLGKQLFYTRQL